MTVDVGATLVNWDATTANSVARHYFLKVQQVVVVQIAEISKSEDI